MGRVTTRARALRVDLAGGAAGERADTVTVEEPLEIRVGGQSLTTTMRTPGDDFDLTLGWLLGEGIIGSADDVTTMMHCTDTDAAGIATFNVVQVTLADGVAQPPVTRSQPATSACGVCGTARIELITERLAGRGLAVAEDRQRFEARVLAGFPDRLREHQQVFARTGGVHAAAVMRADGSLRHVREDIGRHNAVDKTIGAALRAGEVPLIGQALVVTSRGSFEITQKGWAAGLPLLATVSAPSSLAIEVAETAGMTLVGFVRDRRFSVYSRPDRIALEHGESRA